MNFNVNDEIKFEVFNCDAWLANTDLADCVEKFEYSDFRNFVFDFLGDNDDTVEFLIEHWGEEVEELIKAYYSDLDMHVLIRFESEE